MNDTKPKITVVGSGYVGMAMSALLSQICNVTVYDIDLKRVNYTKAIEQKEISSSNLQTFCEITNILRNYKH